MIKNSEKTIVSKRDLALLRAEGLLHDGEIAYLLGDLLVAESMISLTRRIINVEHSSILLETTKKLLKG